MRHEAGSYRVWGLPFQRTEVSHHLPDTLPEAKSSVVHSQRSSVKVTFPSHGVKEFEVIHCHLQNFSFLQFRGTLLLKSTGHQSPELRQAVVDPVPSPLFYDPSSLLSGQNLRGTARRHGPSDRTVAVLLSHVDELVRVRVWGAVVMRSLHQDGWMDVEAQILFLSRVNPLYPFSDPPGVSLIKSWLS